MAGFGNPDPQRPTGISSMNRVAAVILLALFVVSSSRGAEPAFRAGAYSADITPPRFPISMNGQMHDQVAQKAFDPLHARCLVLDDGASKIVIAVCDSCMIPRSILDEAKRRASEATGIPADRMLVSATHTHTAPAAAGVFQTEPNPNYLAFLTERIAEGIVKAAGNLAPARVGWGVGSDPTQVYCRRWLMKPGTALTNPFGGTAHDLAQMHPGFQNPNALRPTGPVDPQIGLLSVQTPEGRPIALLANYAMHYAGYGIPAGQCSADYFGRFCAKVEQALGAKNQDGPPFVAILSNGPCAETHCFDYSKPRQETTIETVSDSVAAHALEAYRQIEHHESAPIVMKEATLTLPLRLADPEEVSRAREVWDRAKAEGRPLRDLKEIYARETVLMSEGPREAELKLQAIRIGELGIAAIPCEVYCETGLALRAVSPMRPMFTIELANGYNGYLTPPEQFPLGGYTTWRARSSCLDRQAEPKVRAAVAQLLVDVSRDNPR
jgi:neutral ceramidase